MADPALIKPLRPAVLCLGSARLRGLLADSPARRSLVILDCCFSVLAVEAAMAALSGLVEAPTTYVLGSTGPHTLALAPTGSRYTAFTGALIDVLRSGLPEGPPLLDVDIVYRAIYERADREGFPIPHLARHGGHQIALSRNRALR